MYNIESILGFEFDVYKFTRLAPTFKIRQKTIEQLQKIKENHQRALTTIPKIDIKKAYRTFVDIARKENPSPEKFSKREIKALAWSLDYKEKKSPYNIAILESQQYLKSAMNLIDTYYRDSMILPLLNYYLNNWILQIAPIKDFISGHIHNYSGRRTMLLNIRKNSEWLLNSRGAVLLAGKFLEEKRDPASVWDFFEFSDYTHSFEYFSEFIMQYTKNLLRTSFTADDLADIIEFLGVHNINLMDKKVLFKIICKLGSGASIECKDAIKRYVLDKIGDSAREDAWSHWRGASESEKHEADEARRIFNEWLTIESIELFFDKISSVVDPEDFKYRKAFWLAYARYIENFRIACSYTINSSLKNDPKFEQFLKNRIANMDGTTWDQCAFIFKIKDYIFVEFGKKGAALYIYSMGNELVPELDQNNYSMNELRHPNTMNYLMSDEGYTRHYYQEGRFGHYQSEQYKWQDKMSWWLKEVLGLNAIGNYRISKNV